MAYRNHLYVFCACILIIYCNTVFTEATRENSQLNRTSIRLITTENKLPIIQIAPYERMPLFMPNRDKYNYREPSLSNVYVISDLSKLESNLPKVNAIPADKSLYNKRHAHKVGLLPSYHSRQEVVPQNSDNIAKPLSNGSLNNKVLPSGDNHDHLLSVLPNSNTLSFHASDDNGEVTYKRTTGSLYDSDDNKLDESNMLTISSKSAFNNGMPSASVSYRKSRSSHHELSVPASNTTSVESFILSNNSDSLNSKSESVFSSALNRSLIEPWNKTEISFNEQEILKPFNRSEKSIHEFNTNGLEIVHSADSSSLIGLNNVNESDRPLTNPNVTNEMNINETFIKPKEYFQIVSSSQNVPEMQSSVSTKVSNESVQVQSSNPLVAESHDHSNNENIKIPVVQVGSVEQPSKKEGFDFKIHNLPIPKNSTAPNVSGVDMSSNDVSVSHVSSTNGSIGQVSEIQHSGADSSPLIPLLKLPNSVVFAVPGVDTPSTSVINDKRDVQKPVPLRKKLKSGVDSRVVSSDRFSNVSIVTNGSTVLNSVPHLPDNITDQGKEHISDLASSKPTDGKTPVSDSKISSMVNQSVNSSYNIHSRVSNNKKENFQSVHVPTDGNINPILRSSPSVSRDQKSAQVFNSVVSSQDTSKQSIVTTPSSIGNATDVEDQEPVACTCGIFLSGQFKRGSRAEPNGGPVVEYQQGQMFPCTSAGKSQCQSKCLELMIKHLPNSGPIVCGSVDRDVYKEKAFLWVKNCHNHWINTNLSSGKEHCCKDSQHIRCSQMKR